MANGGAGDETTRESDRDSGASGAQEPRAERLTYQGIRFPWWLTLVWIAFAAWGAIYLLLYFVPDLRGWLQH